MAGTQCVFRFLVVTVCTLGCALDGLLVELKTVSDRCDVEYGKTVKELKAEDFLNRCRQERLDEHLVWLEMKESELETTTAEAESEEEKQSLIDRQTVVADQIEELDRRLRIVVATLAVEEYFQHEGDQVTRSVNLGLVHVLRRKYCM